MTVRSRFILSIALAGAAGCSLSGNAEPPSSADAAPGAPATDTLSRVAITSLPGASTSAGIEGTFVPNLTPPYGHAAAPKLSNSVVSALPGTPPKPLFVGQDLAYDAIIVAIDGKSGYFKVPGDGNVVLALDLVASLDATGVYTILVATKTNDVVSAPATVTMVIDPHVFVSAGDLENHDSDSSNVADMFGTVLERKQGSPPAPTQVEDDHNNNNDIPPDGIKGPIGPLATGHREVVWDGVPETLRNKDTFKAGFFDRQPDGTAGVRGGITFTATDGTGLEVNDALDGATPDPTLVGPPTHENAPVGGDFSNVNAAFAGDLLAFTQSASFAPIGTTTTDITFHVAGTAAPGVVDGLGIVFASVDRPQTSYVEYFDEQGRSIARVYAPVQALGPFPEAGPLSAGKFPYSFVGYIDHDARIARVRVVSGEVPVDTAANDLPDGNQDVVVFDDVYYGEPKP